METPPPESGTPQPRLETLTLEEPIRRGETTIDAVQMRKPNAGALRGLQLQSLLQGDVNSIIAVLPRITMPPLTGPEAENLDPVDLAAAAGIINGFFMSKAEQALIAKVMGGMGSETSSA